MSAYELITDLEKKLTLYRDRHTWRVSSPNRIHEKIAFYINKAIIYPRPLTRRNVAGILSGKDSWVTREGAECCIAHRVDIAELEQARLIEFPNDDLLVKPAISSNPNMPIKLRHQVQAHYFLYQICYLDAAIEPLHLTLQKDAIAPADLLFLEDSLEDRGETYRVKIKREDVSGVGTYLWKILLSTGASPDSAFATYVSKMRLAARSAYIFEIDFDHDIDSKQYLECAYNYVTADKALFEGWEACAADVAINHSRVESITKLPPRMELRVKPGEPDKLNRPPEQYCGALDISLLNGIIHPLSNQPPTTLLEGAEWWEKVGDYRYPGRETISEYLISLIIRHEHNLYTPCNSFPITRRLISLSHHSPKLTGALFSDTTHPPYVCFLLSNLETNHIGLIHIYRSLERQQRPISEITSYETLWRDLVWAQAIEVFHSSYDRCIPLGDIQGTIDQLCEMLAWFVAHELGYNARRKLIADTHIASLKNALRTIRYLGESGAPINLATEHIALFCESIRVRLATRSEHGILPLGDWLILIWQLEWATLSHTLTGKPVSESSLICDILIESYIKVLNKRLEGDTSATDDPLAFDELEWHRVYESASPQQCERWLKALDKQEAISLTNDAKKSRDIVFAARMHFRLLIQLFNHTPDDPERRLFSSIIINIIDRFGFTPERHSGFFDYMHDNSDYSPVRLWPALCQAANSFTPAEFKNLVIVLRERQAPLSSLFVLLERIASFAHKKLTLGLIAERNLEPASPDWTPEAFDIILKAANNGQMKIAREYLNFVLTHAHKTFNNKTAEISAKLDLKDLFDDNKLSDEDKISQLRTYTIISDDRQVLNETESFRRYLIASLTIYLDKTTALRMFSEALETEKTLQNATGLIKTVLSWPTEEKLPASLDYYFHRWLEVYEDCFESDLKAQLSDAELNYVLQLCLATSHFEDFKRFWNVASDQQRLAYELALPRAEYLKRTAGSSDALAYLYDLRAVHQSLPPDVQQSLAEIEENLKNDGAVVITKAQPLASPEIGSRYDRLRAAWLDIKDLGAYEQSQIFKAPTNSIDRYLIELIENVGLELLKRAGNLLRKKPTAPSPSTIQLDEEDMINDWFVSLVSHRMDFAGWKMYDQSRIGRSGTGNSVGKCDGWVEDSTGKPVFLFEAFRLGNYINTSAIDEHLNKLHKYNAAGVSSIFVIVYVASHRFQKLCSDYKEYVNKIDYDGFELGSGSGLTLRDAPSISTNATYFNETRRVNGINVSIYHHLLHFSPPE